MPVNWFPRLRRALARPVLIDRDVLVLLRGAEEIVEGEGARSVRLGDERLEESVLAADTAEVTLDVVLPAARRLVLEVPAPHEGERDSAVHELASRSS